MTLAARTTTRTRWPDAVWDVAILRGLDARARGEIEAAGRIRELRAGDVVHRAGEPADSVCVVLEGRVALVAVRRGEAQASVIRRASEGEIFGEEPILLGASAARQMEARCEANGAVADVPLVVLRRALGRAGAEEIAARLERALRRAATHDLLRTTAFTRALPARDVEILLDAARHVHVARGEHVYREGDASDAAYLVADGLLQTQTDDDGRPRVEAYLSRGDLFGDAELEGHDVRATSVAASGPAWLVALPRDVFVVVARRNAALLDGVRRVRGETALGGVPGAARGGTTAHVFKDLYRMRVARSLLVIDQSSCVRCGHCAWSCASAHDDGISRLVRRGERVVVKTESEKAPLLVPNSCQHCKNPACMIDCPTGAIGRDARGEVFIREELCTGCGQCAKACPWDNIAMAPRAKTAKTPFTEVAVKCDLCSGMPAGPACVASCPTQSILRIDPNEALVELGGAPALPRRAPAWPWVSGAAVASVAGAFVHAPALTSGVVAGALVAALAAYAAVRRAPKITARVRASRRLGRVAYVAHLAVGVLAAGALVAHTSNAGSGGSAGVLAPDAGGALALALIVALASGALGAALQVLVPPRMARLERKVVLPEVLAARAKELDETLFALLSGKAEIVKTLYARVLRPYRLARTGPAALVVTGRSHRDEEKRLRARVDALLEGRARGPSKASDATRGIDELVRVVVEHRAVRAQRVLGIALRAWVPVHVAAAAASVALLVAHVLAIALARGAGR